MNKILVPLWLASAIAACAPEAKTGLQASITVPATGRSGERVRRLTVAFDRPMVARRAIGQPVARPPLVLEPAVAGAAQWLDERTLLFAAVEPLPRATAFRVRVPRGTAALDGSTLARAVEHRFETERVELRASLEREDGLPDPLRWATPGQRVALAFTQPVAGAEVRRRCAYVGEAGRIAARPVDEGAGEARERFLVAPATPLAPGTRYTFRCEDDLRPVEGPLGMVPAGPDAGAPGRRALAFETYGPLRVVHTSPSGAASPDESWLRIELSTPLQRADEGVPVTITPALDGFPGRAHVSGSSLLVSLPGLQPNTAYGVVVGEALRDVFGQTLTGVQAAFRTGDASPRFDLETGSWVVEAARGSLPLWARNLTTLEVTAAAIPEGKLTALLPALDWWDDRPADLAALKVKAVKRQVPVNGRPNRWDQVVLDPRALLGPAAPPAGFYYFAVSAPELARARQARPDEDGEPAVKEVLVSFTSLGVTAKLASSSGLVWVTRLADGAPQPGAEVLIRDRAGKVRWRGRTGADGTVETPGRAQLAPPAPRPTEAPDEDEENEEDDWGGGPRRAGLLVFVRLGNDVTMVDPESHGAFEGWHFSVPVSRSDSAEELRGFAHTDRGLYRPGETVHLRGLVRAMRLGQGLALPRARRAEVVVRDPRGERIFSRTVALSRYGGFHADVPLPADARLGDYTMEARLPGGVFRERFAVEEYRAAAFEVKVKAAAPRSFAGDRLQVSVEGRYLYGAPMRKAAVKWRLSSRPRAVSFPQLPEYVFDDLRPYDDDDEGHGGEAFFAEESGTLDAEGRARLALPLPRDAFPQTRDLLISADVQDESNQTITGSLVVPVHRARVYFGIAHGEYLVPAGKPTRVRVVAVDPAGERVAAAATLTVKRREWSCAWETWGYRGSYRCEKKETAVLERPIEIEAAQPLEASFTPPAGGQYVIVVEGRGPGEAAVAARSTWAWGQGETPWRMDEGARFELVADKPRYRVGDTARLLLKTPLAGATALVTVEREGLLERRLVDLAAAGQTLEIPIRASYGPNVYVSVLLARGRTGPGARGLPTLRMGLATLNVDSEDRRLQVAVTTDRATYRPGEKVTATVEVRDAAGRPVAAEVALAAADEGVLSLIAFATPDPMRTFYAPWALGVRTTTQYERLARLPEPGQERYATGGDGPGRLGTLRSRFLATAYWNPRLETDARGRAQVTFEAPDNLTAFRLMAVAADAGERFGSGDRRFTVRKPLQLLGALPRFLAVGDETRGGVVVVNDTGAAGEATVEVKVEGAELVGPRRRTISLPAGGRAAVTFPVTAAEPGRARFRFTAALGGERDGLALELPIGYPTAGETTLVAAGEATAASAIPVALPAGVLPGSASLEVSVDPDGLAGIEEGLRDLIEYPYGCLEQTTSRLIPLVAVQELARTLGLPDLDGPRLERFIRIAVEKIGRHQDEDGGFGLWPGARSEPYLTAFALWGLKLSQEAGYAVDRRRLEQGVAYLRRSLEAEGPRHGVHHEQGELGSRAFALYVLDRLGRPDAGYAARLLERRDELPRFGLAFLARALAGPLGAGHAQVASLLDGLLAAADRQPRWAVIREAGGDALRWYMSSDARTSAIALDAFVALRPEEPAIPQLVRGLLAERRGGAWQTTQENLFALVALAHYVKTRPPGGASARVLWDGRAIVEGPLAAGGPARIRRASVALTATGPAQPLHIEPAGGPVHYQVRLRFRRDRAHQPAVESGFTLRREFLDPTTGAPVTSVKAGEMVRVRLTVSAPEERSRVAITDWLPAGLEAMNSRFATTGTVPDRPAEDRARDLWIQHRELRDDRVSVFADHFWPGTYAVAYLARATTAGTYVVPGATVEEMYRPDVRARTPLTTLTVQER